MKTLTPEETIKSAQQIQQRARDAKMLCDPSDRTPFNEAIASLRAHMEAIETECAKILE